MKVVFYSFVQATLLGLLCFVLTACNPPAQKQIRSELTGSQQERIARATAILNKYCRVPAPLLDAHMTEDVQNNSTGLVPGPSDSSLSGVLLVATSDLPAWRAVLAPALTSPPPAEFTSACHLPPPSWWPAAAVQKDSEFYAPAKLTGRYGGFVAVSSSASAIYFSAF